MASQRLGADPGRVIRANAGHPRATDGPYSETKEVLGGYFLFEAPNYDEAVRISQDCPSLEYKGSMELRQVDAMIP